MLPAARAIPIDARTTDLVIAGGLTLVTGWSFRETTAAAGAVFRLFDGSGTGGTLLASISLNSGESTRDLIPAPFVGCEGGLFLDMVSGTVEGSVWVIEASSVFDGYAAALGVHAVWAGQS